MAYVAVPFSPEAAHHRARLAALKRAVRNGERPADDPELASTERDFAAARTADHIERLLANAPELTDEQRDRLAELLWPTRQGGAA